ncbi:type I glyceraldehyde-3-phosphate dehydrogenase [Candidatus Spongiisocius sp.]|uniref:type I glyceraldehyde-3-phosphate dehydrogenase n=1 Tax=Candidatus Spongiisocius sp. TaxID=3101273 RepID=UPI003B5C9B78
MTTRVAINGFGRIGRAVLRIILSRPSSPIEVVAINDLADHEVLAYLLRRDSVMGTLENRVTVRDGRMTVGGHHILMVRETSPAALPWRDLEVDVVIESTGAFRTRDLLEQHLEAGAGRVLLTVPAKDPIDSTVVLGVNEGDVEATDRIISNASCTTNCLAPVAKVLDDEFGIVRGVMTTVHAYTNDQRLADVPHKDLRRSRAATENIIPTSTGAARAVGTVLPAVSGKLDGMAMRVPVPDGSLVELVAELSTEVDAGAVNGAMRRAARGPMRNVLQYSEEPLVSSDIIGNAHSSIFDAGGTEVLGERLVKVVSWYDNEWGYSSRVVDLIELLGTLPAPA